MDAVRAKRNHCLGFSAIPEPAPGHLSRGISAPSALLTLRITATRDEFPMRIRSTADLLDGFLQNYLEGTMPRRWSGDAREPPGPADACRSCDPARTTAPRRRRTATWQCFAIPARAVPAARKGKTQMHADKKDARRWHRSDIGSPPTRQPCADHPRSSLLIRVHLRFHFLLPTQGRDRR